MQNLEPAVPTANSLSIAQVSAADFGGGAERVAFDLHRWLYARGVDSWLLVGFRHLSEPNTIQIPNDKVRSLWARTFGAMVPPLPIPPASLSPERRVQRQVLKAIGEPYRALRLARGFDDVHFPATARLLELLPTEPHVVNIHNMHGGYFDLRQLPSVARRVPTVITLHDVWLSTGHCAYPIECERWLNGCGECPHLEYPPAARRDQTAANWALKKRVFRECEGLIDYVAPSRWAALRIERSIAAPSIRSMHVIPNGVNTAVFEPAASRDALRAELGIGPNARVVAYLASSPSNPYKDVVTAHTALDILGSSWHAHAIGTGPAGETRELVYLAIGDTTPREHHGARSIGIPYSTNPADTASALQAADLFVHAARAEVCPLMLIEAQACGVPVVATNVGGVADVVESGRTGMLSEVGEAVGLAAHLDALLRDDDVRHVMSLAARENAVTLFSIERMLDSYLALYEEIARETGKVRVPRKMIPSA